MSHNGIFHFTGFTCLDLNDFGYDNSSGADDLFNGSNNGENTGFGLQNYQYAGPRNVDNSSYLQPQEVGSSSRHYTGMEDLGGMNGLQHLNDPMTAPTTLYPGKKVSHYEGESYSTFSK